MIKWCVLREWREQEPLTVMFDSMLRWQIEAGEQNSFYCIRFDDRVHRCLNWPFQLNAESRRRRNLVVIGQQIRLLTVEISSLLHVALSNRYTSVYLTSVIHIYDTIAVFSGGEEDVQPTRIFNVTIYHMFHSNTARRVLLPSLMKTRDYINMVDS